MATGTAGEQERGRDADVPSEIPKAGWRDILLRLKDAVREDRITLIAAGVAFYAMLALFPAMIVVVSIYGLAMDPEEIAAQVRTLVRERIAIIAIPAPQTSSQTVKCLTTIGGRT